MEYQPRDQEEQFKNQVEEDQAKYQELKYYWQILEALKCYWQILGGAEVLLTDTA